MSDLNMNIVIGATVDKATQGLNQVSHELATTATAAQKVDSSLLGSSTSAAKAGAAFTTLSASAQKPTASLTGLTGSISSLVGSIVGTSGLLLAVGIVKEIIAEYGRHAEEARKRTEAFNKAIGEATASAETEATKLTALVSVAKDYTESQVTRKNAIDQLQKLYPGYLSNLNLENINSQEAAHSIELLTEAIGRKAKVQALSNLLTKAEEELIQKQNSGVKENLNAFERLFYSIGNKGIIGFTMLNDAARNQKEDLKILQGVIDDYREKLTALITVQARSNDFKLLDPTKIKELKEQKDKAISILQDLNTNIKDIPKNFIGAIAIETGDALEAMNRVLSKGPGLKVPSIDDLIKKITESNELKKVAKQMDQIKTITEGVQNAFDSLFYSIANGANVFDAIGQALKQLLTKIVATVIEAAILSVILNSIFPGLGAGAGGKFTFGSLLSQLSGLPKFATGGVITRPTLAMVGEVPEKITPLNQMSNNSGGSFPSEIILRAAGSELRTVLKRDGNNNYFIN